MRSPQSIIFTAVTDGRPAGCNYFYRYWGHLEVVSPHWKTEALSSHKGQVFITCSLTWIHRRIRKSNWMRRHKEKRHFSCFSRGKKVETNNSEFTFHLELSSSVSLMCFQTLDGKGRHDGAQRWWMCACKHIRSLARWGGLRSEGASPRGKPAMTSRASAGVGLGREVSHRKLGEADFAMPLTGCGRAGERRRRCTSAELVVSNAL